MDFSQVLVVGLYWCMRLVGGLKACRVPHGYAPLTAATSAAEVVDTAWQPNQNLLKTNEMGLELL